MGSKERSKHDVFVNFRGPDTRKVFVTNLHRALLRSGIKAFVDSEDLHLGQKLTPALAKAIERSLVAIVVFSQDYASSEWCLKELAKIVECSKLKEQMVTTVFYRVEPRQVRRRTGHYEEGMAKHERRHGKDPDTVEKWRHALFIASMFPGLHLEDNSDEAKFIRGVVEDVKAKLRQVEAKRKSNSIPPNLHRRQLTPHAFGFDQSQPASTLDDHYPRRSPLDDHLPRRSTLDDPWLHSTHDDRGHSPSMLHSIPPSPSMLHSVPFPSAESWSSLSSLARANPSLIGAASMAANRGL